MATGSPPDLPALTGPPPKPGKYAKLSVHFKKRPDISDEYFYAYWANNHVSGFLAFTVGRDKIKGYSQASFSRCRAQRTTSMLTAKIPLENSVTSRLR